MGGRVTIILPALCWCSGLWVRLFSSLAPIGKEWFYCCKCCISTRDLPLKLSMALLHVCWWLRPQIKPRAVHLIRSLFVLVLLSGIVECNGGVAEEDEVEVILAQEPAADQEVPRDAVLPEQSPGEFDFNEFFNLDKVPGLASVSVAAHL